MDDRIKILFLKFIKINKVYKKYKNNINHLKHIDMFANMPINILIKWEDYYLEKIHNTNKTHILNEFLQKNNIKESYYKIIHKHHVIVNNLELFSMIDGAFMWSSTDEGYYFWRDINVSYNTYIKNNYYDL